MSNEQINSQNQESELSNEQLDEVAGGGKYDDRKYDRKYERKDNYYGDRKYDRNWGGKGKRDWY